MRRPASLIMYGGNRAARSSAARRTFHLGVSGDGMQMRSKAYQEMISRLRALRVLRTPRGEPTPRQASPVLILIAAVLALLLAMVEIDRHSGELRSLGLAGNPYPVDPIFMSP